MSPISYHQEDTQPKAVEVTVRVVLDADESGKRYEMGRPYLMGRPRPYLMGTASNLAPIEEETIGDGKVDGEDTPDETHD